MNRRDRKVRRTFSTSFKKEKVSMIEQGKLSVRDLCLTYEVSDTAVYKWLKKYGKHAPSERVVVEKISEEAKNRELMAHIRELEGVIGRKQLELDYYKTAIEELSKEEGEDVLKKYRPK